MCAEAEYCQVVRQRQVNHLHLIKDSVSYKELAENNSAKDLIDNLDNNGQSKVIDPPRSVKSGEAIKFTNPENGDVIRIMPNPTDGKPYFRVQNKGGGWLDEYGNFPADATKKELRNLTHFYFKKQRCSNVNSKWI